MTFIGSARTEESDPLYARATETARLLAQAGFPIITGGGPGIASEVLDRLFTPFVTTKQAGTGLGLALVQKAIVCHDGEITASNADGGGACFSITLPTQARGLPG